MLKQTRYFFAALLLWPSRVAEAQAYAPEQTAPTSTVFIYIVVIGIVGVALFFVYRISSRRIEETPQSALRTQPKTQPAPKPIPSPPQRVMFQEAYLSRTGVTIVRTLRVEFTTGSYSTSPRRSFSRTWTRSRLELILDSI
jgi:hypothetical protein